MRENKLQQQIRLAVGQIDGVICWRNQVGMATHGQRKFPYGLCPGSSDLILLVRGFFTAPQIGQVYPIPLGRFAAFEIKTAKGRASADQKRFIRLVRANGGFADIIRSVEQAQHGVELTRNGYCQLPNTEITPEEP